MTVKSAITGRVLPNRGDISTFRITHREYHSQRNRLLLHYAFDDAIEFTESLQFPSSCYALQTNHREVLEKLFDFLHVAAGISYYKAFVPQHILVDNQSLSPLAAQFFNIFYRKGLAEFAFRNGLSLANRVFFHGDIEAGDNQAIFLPLKPRVAIPVGGGKDSVVTLESFKQAGYNPLAVSVGQPAPIVKTIETAGVDWLTMSRKIAPTLLELNDHAQECGSYNGHVPVTGILAFILASMGVMCNYSYVAMSNERSANAATLTDDLGVDVNHQWSKSFEFEVLFNTLLSTEVVGGFNYFSFLRPVSELAIAGVFAKLTQYHDVFTSCNRAFTLDEAKRAKGWCCACDKCRFVFLALAAHMSPKDLTRIFGTNLLDDADHIQGFAELLGLSGHKPFECVGEVAESVTALLMAAKRESWAQCHVVKTLLPKLDIDDAQFEKLKKQFMTPAKEHRVPPHFLEDLDALFGH